MTSSRAQRQRAQDVASASSSSSSSSSAAAAASSRVGALATHKMKSLDEFLEGLPELSVGQKHSASFECELAEFDLQSTDALEVSVVVVVVCNIVRATLHKRADNLFPMCAREAHLAATQQKHSSRRRPHQRRHHADNFEPEADHARRALQSAQTFSAQVDATIGQCVAARLGRLFCVPAGRRARLERNHRHTVCGRRALERVG